MAGLAKAELIKQVAEDTGETKAAVERIINSLQENIIDAVADGKEIRLTNFASFSPETRSARVIKNPHTKEEISVPEMRVAKIKPLSKFRERVSSKKISD